jgi:hypothetical protein
MTKFLLSILLLVTAGCKTRYDVVLKVYEDRKLTVITEDKKKLELFQGEGAVRLVLNTKRPHRSYFTLDMRLPSKSISTTVPLKLPALDVVLGSNDAVKLSAAELGQSFGMMVMRTPGKEKDSFAVTFHDPDFDETLGEMSFETDKISTQEADDESLLATYQKVKRKNRAAIIKMDGGVKANLDFRKGFKWLEPTFDHIVNYSGVVLISPWVYARYKHIEWLVGQDEEGEFTRGWMKTVAKYPVIDYFAFVHSGNQHLPSKSNDYLFYYGGANRLSMADVGLKQNQLRAVYTGACESGTSSEWLTNYGAVVAAGQRNLSASPLFQFVVVTKWIYGFSFEDAIVKAWKAGVRRVRALEWVTFAKLWQNRYGVLLWNNADDMLFDSEIQFSATSEAPAHLMEITKTKTLSGMPTDKDLILSSASRTIAKREGKFYVDAQPKTLYNDK